MEWHQQRFNFMFFFLVSKFYYLFMTQVPKEVLQEALLLQRGCAMFRVCIASIQNFERSLLLLVVSTSDIPLHTIKLFSVLFSGVPVYRSMLQAVTNKHSLVRRRLCDLGLHCMVLANCFLSLCSSHVQQSSIASYYTRIAICAIPHLHLTPTLGGFPSRMARLTEGEKISKICLFVLI